MPPNPLCEREKTTQVPLANQLTQFPLSAAGAAAEQRVDDLVTFGQVFSHEPALVEQFKQELIRMGKWPNGSSSSGSSTSSAASPNSSRDQAAGDSSGSGDGPSSSSTGKPMEAWQHSRRSRKVLEEPGSDESANAKEDKTSISSMTAPDRPAAESDCSGSSDPGTTGRNQCASEQVEAWLSNRERANNSDGQSSEEKDSENSDGSTPAPSRSGVVTGASGGTGGGTSGGVGSPAQRWHREPCVSISMALQEGPEDWAKAADAENSSDDSGAQLPPDLVGLGMDCLPQDAVVWVQGHDTPKKTIELQPGDQVLCFDSLGGSVKYAEVVDVRADDEPVEWVQVELADGTTTVLTADHPVQLAGKHALQGAVKAKDIEPQNSRIVVHRVATRPVRVSKVVRLPPGLLHADGHVGVSVMQPDRNSILVASPGQGREGVHLVSVGSADLMSRPCGLVKTRVHHTTPLIFPEEVGRRPHSWPPDHGSRLALSLAAPRLRLPPRHQAGSSSGAGQDSSVGSYQDSSSETSSGGEAMVLLPWILPNSAPDAARAASLQAPRGLSELLQARMSNWPSIGSSEHPHACHPCAFDHKGRCTAGAWCPRCHDQHRKRNGKLIPIRRPPRDRNNSNG